MKSVLCFVLIFSLCSSVPPVFAEEQPAAPAVPSAEDLRHGQAAARIAEARANNALRNFQIADETAFQTEQATQKMKAAADSEENAEQKGKLEKAAKKLETEAVRLRAQATKLEEIFQQETEQALAAAGEVENMKAAQAEVTAQQEAAREAERKQKEQEAQAAKTAGEEEKARAARDAETARLAEEQRRAGEARDQEIRVRDEEAVNRMIPQLAVQAAPQGQTPLDTPLDHAFVLSEDIGNLQTKFQDREREIENNKREANRAGNRGENKRRDAFLHAANDAETELGRLRTQIEQKEGERSAHIETVRRLGSSAHSNVDNAIHLNDIARDETLGNEMRRMDPTKVRGAAGTVIPGDLLPLSEKFSADGAAMQAVSKDARVVETLSKMDMKDLGRNTAMFQNLDRSLKGSNVSDAVKKKVTLLKDAAAAANISPLFKSWSENDIAEYVRLRGGDEAKVQSTLAKVRSSNRGEERNRLWREANLFVKDTQRDVAGRSGEALFMETMGEAGQSLKQNRQGLEDRFREVSGEINKKEKEKKGTTDEAQIRQIDNDLSTLHRRQENLQYAMLAGTQNAQSPMDTKELAQRGQREHEIMLEQKRLRAAGRDDAEIQRVANAMRAQPLPKEDKGFCAAAWDMTKRASGATWGFISGIPGGIATGAKWVGGGLLEAGSFFGQYGTPIKQALFASFSALAQWRYTQKGSQNSDTEVYRGLAIALGLDMGFKSEMPRGMMEAVDPLTPFKRPVLSSQQVISQQDEVLRNVLNIGGNPSSAGGFPYGAQDQLQAILESTRPGAPGSQVPGSRFPASAAGAFPGIYDPSYQNFTGQAYNGFPPLPSTPTQGAILNPNFGAGNPFMMGSGLAALAQQTNSSAQGKQNLGNLVAATAAERGGIQNFRQQLEGIHPPGNSLKDLIDGVARVDASSSALTARNQNINQVISQGSASLANSQMLEQYARYNTELRKLSDINHDLFEAAQQFRRFDFEIQRDEDGLMMGSPKDWSKNMNARNEALLRLLDATQKRNEAMTNIAYMVYNPALYQRIIKQTPTVPISTPPTRASQLWHEFFIRPLWAAEVLGAAPSFVSGWRGILEEEKRRTEKELAQNRQEKVRLMPQIERLVALDPDGVHEINVPVLQVEELNMKAIALQTDQNLEKIKKAEETVKVSIKMTPQEKEETSKQMTDYRFLLSQLKEEAKQCANELAKVERLQLEKRTEFEIFHHFKPQGEKLLGRMPSSL